MIQIDFGENVKVNNFTLFTKGIPDTHKPKKLNIEGSNNAISFDIFQTVSKWTVVDVEVTVVNFKNENKYRYYKINILENNGGVYTGLDEIILSYKNLKVIQLPLLS
ncbi:hypothetical protein [Lysinibacillus sp. NPDC093692]|uniref:hypothetical protein n=1 Tax=Lysinibacillus sp. NPDC093692 TaxID=3390578 RepID=UPI003CFC2319